MRNARLVGLSPDGTTLIVADDRGEELALAADDRLRATLRRDVPQPGRRETPMDSPLSPRDIQTRIRAGESLEDVAAVAGLPLERVERFAAPVLAEREHLALMALSSTVRRRGETSGHRNLRTTVADRLLKQGVDVDRLVWDAHRVEDGRWAVTGRYARDEDDRSVTFWFDPRGRFSVPADDAARRLIGEQPPAAGPGRGDRSAAAAEEATVDLSDELALVRAVSEPGPRADAEATVTSTPAEVVHTQPELTVVRALRPVPAADHEPADQPGPAQDEGRGRRQPAPAEPMPPESPAEQAGTDQAGAEQPNEAGDDPARDAGAPSDGAGPSELDALYDILGSEGSSEDSPRVYAGLSDAAAVPETAGGGWEPALDVNYPVEPSPQEEAELPAGQRPDRGRVPMDDRAPVELTTPVDPRAGEPGRSPGTDEPTPSSTGDEQADQADQAEVEEFQLESEPAPLKPAKRKRASVPSWDEIMFGGPKPPS